jgi:hypothetical protein
VDGIEASAVFVTSLLTKLNAATLGKFAVVELGVRLALALRKWFSQPTKDTIVQAFELFQKQEGTEVSYDLSLQEMRPGLLPSIQDTVDPHESPPDCSLELKAARAAFWDAGPWTEDKHDYLMSLPSEMAVEVVKSLSPTERHVLINVRLYQESYIADYLSDLWKINRSAFWRGMETMFKSPEGLILGEVITYIELMSSKDMPRYVWMALLRCLLNVEINGSGIFAEFYHSIVVFQTMEASKMETRCREFNDWHNRLNDKDRNSVRSFLREAFNGEIPEWVHNKE